MSTAETTIVSADVLDDLARLEPLARAIFGEGQRPEGWFARKLHREVVSKAASRLVVAPGHAPDDPRGWLGYGLLGLPPSLRGVARTAGIGLRPSARGQGLGARLLDALKRAAFEHEHHTLEIPASADSVGFYARAGLAEHRRGGTWLAFGRGRTTGSHHIAAPASWAPVPPGRVIAGWLEEAWERTPASARYRWDDGTQTLDVSVEGIAHLVHRWATSAGGVDTAAAATAGLASWLDHLPSGTPALLSNIPHGDEASALRGMLDQRGWVCVQAGVSMRTATASNA